MIAFGCDFARGGADKNVIAVRRDLRIEEIHRFQNNDTVETVARIVEVALQWKPNRIVCDVIGIGAGPFDRLRELGLPVISFNAATRAEETDLSGELHFLNLRSYAWWSFRERLDPTLGQPVELPLDDDVLADLSAPKWKLTASGAIQIEGKEDIRKRLKKSRDDGGSTDVGDAIVMAFFDGSASIYETGYRVHTTATLAEAAGPKPAVTTAELVAAQAAYERKVLYGVGDDDDGEPTGGETTLWYRELVEERWW